MALSVEVSELVEIFQWLTPEESWGPPTERVKEEIGDILIYTLMIADKLGIDVEIAVNDKIESNRKKYPPI
jgi:NTP pyrophosphatase (non-canonical NTP hydrolase)